MFETIREKIENGNKKIILFIIVFVILFLFILLGVISLKKFEEVQEPIKAPLEYRQRDHMAINPEICSQKEDNYEKERCFSHLKLSEVLKEENIKKCLEIKYSDLRDDCVKTLAAYYSISADKLCMAVSDKEKRFFCLDRALITKRNPQLCEEYYAGEPFELQECKDRISAFDISEKGGPEEIFKCPEIQSLEYPNLCLWRSFEIKYDNDCSKVPEKFRDYCISYYIDLEAESEEECMKIPLADHKKFCLIKVRAGGWPFIADLDSDNDGETDWNELFVGIDPYNPDTDGDGLLDGEESPMKLGSNPKVKDTDGDGLSDYEEAKIYKTSINKVDTNGNGISDGDEVKQGRNPMAGDSDKDRLMDVDEEKYGTDINNPDTDGDGMSDFEETRSGYNPLVSGQGLSDTDGDGLLDIDEVFYGTDRFLPDTDGDGISDRDEVDNLTNPLGEGDMDFDGDGISDKDEEERYKTNPSLADSDDDGLSDYEEIFIYKTNPKVKDTDGDGYSDGEEVKKGYNPLSKD